MKKIMLSIVLGLSSFYLSGCIETGFDTTQGVSTENPDAEEILSLDEKADIFQWEELIYQTDIDWVNEMELTKKEPLGEIEGTFDKDSLHLVKNGMANKLPIGARVYSTEENGILIVDVNGVEKYYLAIVEG